MLQNTVEFLFFLVYNIYLDELLVFQKKRRFYLKMELTFHGGIRVDDNKNARKSKIELFPAPQFVTIPLSQHIGAPAKPLVKVGDIVDKGQMIADNDTGLSCPVHSSISGKIISIDQGVLQTGVKTDFIKIENDYAERLHVSVQPYGKKISETSADEIIEFVRSSGISGLGGATFPTYAKIQSAKNRVSTLIINCAECEPYITANHRLMLESPEYIVNGMKILMKALGLRVGYIAVEDNKLDAVTILSEFASKNKMVEIKVLKTKYPQGDERQIIYALTGKQLPAGKLPADYSCVVFNVETCAAICNAFVSGMPLIDRIVTIDGDCIISPKNLKVPLGTPVSALIEYCGLKKEPKKIINGGPMMGTAIFDINMPVTKGTSAILAFSEKMLDKTTRSCIHCGKCVSACAMGLSPAYLAMFSQKHDMERCEKYDVLSCVECGCCTYICPAAIPIVQHIRTAKGKINETRKRDALIASAKQADIPVPKEYEGRAAQAGREIKKE